MMPFRSETFPGGFSAQKVWGNLGLQGEAHWREKGEVDSLHVSGAARWRAAWHARIAGLGWSLRPSSWSMPYSSGSHGPWGSN